MSDRALPEQKSVAKQTLLNGAGNTGETPSNISAVSTPAPTQERGEEVPKQVQSDLSGLEFYDGQVEEYVNGDYDKEIAAFCEFQGWTVEEMECGSRRFYSTKALTDREGFSGLKDQLLSLVTPTGGVRIGGLGHAVGLPRLKNRFVGVPLPSAITEQLEWIDSPVGEICLCKNGDVLRTLDQEYEDEPSIEPAILYDFHRPHAVYLARCANSVTEVQIQNFFDFVISYCQFQKVYCLSDPVVVIDDDDEEEEIQQIADDYEEIVRDQIPEEHCEVSEPMFIREGETLVTCGQYKLLCQNTKELVHYKKAWIPSNSYYAVQEEEFVKSFVRANGKVDSEGMDIVRYLFGKETEFSEEVENFCETMMATLIAGGIVTYLDSGLEVQVDLGYDVFSSNDVMRFSSSPCEFILKMFCQERSVMIKGSNVRPLKAVSLYGPVLCPFTVKYPSTPVTKRSATHPKQIPKWELCVVDEGRIPGSLRNICLYKDVYRETLFSAIRDEKIELSKASNVLVLDSQLLDFSGHLNRHLLDNPGEIPEKGSTLHAEEEDFICVLAYLAGTYNWKTSSDAVCSKGSEAFLKMVRRRDENALDHVSTMLSGTPLLSAALFIEWCTKAEAAGAKGSYGLTMFYVVLFSMMVINFVTSNWSLIKTFIFGFFVDRVRKKGLRRREPEPDCNLTSPIQSMSRAERRRIIAERLRGECFPEDLEDGLAKEGRVLWKKFITESGLEKTQGTHVPDVFDFTSSALTEPIDPDNPSGPDDLDKMMLVFQSWILGIEETNQSSDAVNKYEMLSEVLKVVTQREVTEFFRGVLTLVTCYYIYTQPKLTSRERGLLIASCVMQYGLGSNIETFHTLCSLIPGMTTWQADESSEKIAILETICQGWKNVTAVKESCTLLKARQMMVKIITEPFFSSALIERSEKNALVEAMEKLCNTGSLMVEAVDVSLASVMVLVGLKKKKSLSEALRDADCLSGLDLEYTKCFDLYTKLQQSTERLAGEDAGEIQKRIHKLHGNIRDRIAVVRDSERTYWVNKQKSVLEWSNYIANTYLKRATKRPMFAVTFFGEGGIGKTTLTTECAKMLCGACDIDPQIDTVNAASRWDERLTCATQVIILDDLGVTKATSSSLQDSAMVKLVRMNNSYVTEFEKARAEEKGFHSNLAQILLVTTNAEDGGLTAEATDTIAATRRLGMCIKCTIRKDAYGRDGKIKWADYATSGLLPAHLDYQPYAILRDELNGKPSSSGFRTQNLTSRPMTYVECSRYLAKAAKRHFDLMDEVAEKKKEQLKCCPSCKMPFIACLGNVNCVSFKQAGLSGIEMSAFDKYLPYNVTPPSDAYLHKNMHHTKTYNQDLLRTRRDALKKLVQVYDLFVQHQTISQCKAVINAFRAFKSLFNEEKAPWLSSLKSFVDEAECALSKFTQGQRAEDDVQLKALSDFANSFLGNSSSGATLATEPMTDPGTALGTIKESPDDDSGKNSSSESVKAQEEDVPEIGEDESAKKSAPVSKVAPGVSVVSSLTDNTPTTTTKCLRKVDILFSGKTTEYCNRCNKERDACNCREGFLMRYCVSCRQDFDMCQCAAQVSVPMPPFFSRSQPFGPRNNMSYKWYDYPAFRGFYRWSKCLRSDSIDMKTRLQAFPMKEVTWWDFVFNAIYHTGTSRCPKITKAFFEYQLPFDLTNTLGEWSKILTNKTMEKGIGAWLTQYQSTVPVAFGTAGLLGNPYGYPVLFCWCGAKVCGYTAELLAKMRAAKNRVYATRHAPQSEEMYDYMVAASKDMMENAVFLKGVKIMAASAIALIVLRHLRNNWKSTAHQAGVGGFSDMEFPWASEMSYEERKETSEKKPADSYWRKATNCTPILGQRGKTSTLESLKKMVANNMLDLVFTCDDRSNSLKGRGFFLESGVLAFNAHYWELTTGEKMKIKALHYDSRGRPTHFFHTAYRNRCVIDDEADLCLCYCVHLGSRSPLYQYLMEGDEPEKAILHVRRNEGPEFDWYQDEGYMEYNSKLSCFYSKQPYRRAYRLYHTKNEAGDCGQPALLEGKGVAFAGWHCTGNNTTMCTYSVLFRNEYEDMIARLRNVDCTFVRHADDVTAVGAGYVPVSDQVHPRSFLNYTHERNKILYRGSVPFDKHFKSEYKLSDKICTLRLLFPSIDDHDFQVPAMKFFRDAGRTARVAGGDMKQLQPEIIEHCLGALKDRLRSCQKKEYKKGVLTLDQALNGIENDYLRKSINGSTSAGYPFSVKKTALLKRDDDGKWIMGSELQEVYDECHLNLLDKKRSGMLWKAFPKDEILPITKGEKTRLVYGTPIALHILFLQYFGTTFDFLVENFSAFNHVIGVSAIDERWRDMIGAVYEGESGIEIDYSSFDTSCHPEILSLLSRFMIDLAMELNDWKDGGTRSTEVSRDMLESLASEWMLPDVDFFGQVVQLPLIFMSGVLITALFNCLRNITLLEYSFQKSRVEQSYNLIYCRELIAHAVMGDDIVAAYRKKGNCAFWNLEKYVKDLAEIGMKVTSAKKDGSEIEVVNPKDLEFLCRKPRYHAGLRRVVGCLKPTSIFKTLLWDPSRFTEGETAYRISQISSVVQELFLYKRETFEKGQEVCLLYLKTYYRNLSIPDHITKGYDIRCEENAGIPQSRGIYSEEDPYEIVWPETFFKGCNQQAGEVEEGTVEVKKDELLTTAEPVDTEQETGTTLNMTIPENAEHLEESVMRWIDVDTFEFPNGAVNHHRVYPYESLMDWAPFRKKFEGFTRFRADVELEFIVTSSPSHYGSFVASIYPFYEGLDVDYHQLEWENSNHDMRLQRMTQRHHLVFSVGEQTTQNILRVPWTHNQPMMKVYSDSFNHLAVVDVSPITPPKHALDGTDSIYVNVRARFSKLYLDGATHAMMPQGNISGEKPSRIASVMAKGLHNASEVFSSIPELAVPMELASRASGIGGDLLRHLGHSAPIDTEVRAMCPGFPSLSTANIDRIGKNLFVDNNGGVAVSGRICGDCTDPLLFSEFLGRKTIISRTTWRADQGRNAPLGRIPVTPAIALETLVPTDVVGTLGYIRLLTPQALVAENFSMWHGTMVYEFEFIGPARAEGKVGFFHELGDFISPLQIGRANCAIMDIGGTRKVMMRVEWTRPDMVAMVNEYKPLLGLGTGEHDDLSLNGKIYIQTLSNLVGPVSPSQNNLEGTIVVRMWMENDAVFYLPRSQLFRRRGEDEDWALASDVNTPSVQVTAQMPVSLASHVAMIPLSSQQQPTAGTSTIAPTGPLTTYRTTGSVPPTTVGPTLEPTIPPTLIGCRSYMVNVSTLWLGGTYLHYLGFKADTTTALPAGSHAVRIPCYVGGDASQGNNITANIRFTGSMTTSVGTIDNTVDPPAWRIVFNRNPAGDFAYVQALVEVQSEVVFTRLRIALPEGYKCSQRNIAASEDPNWSEVDGVTLLSGNVYYGARGGGQGLTTEWNPICPCGLFTPGSVTFKGIIRENGTNQMNRIEIANYLYGDKYTDSLVHSFSYGAPYGVFAITLLVPDEYPQAETVDVHTVGTSVPRTQVLRALAGEDVVSFRSLLSRFTRISDKFEVKEGEEVLRWLYQYGNYNHPHLFNVLMACFAGLRGGMNYAYYVTSTDGALAVGRKLESGGSVRDTPYELLDTRINPMLIVTHPWQSYELFTPVRQVGFASAGEELMRSVFGLRDSVVEEHGCIAEDFTFVLFRGTPFFMKIYENTTNPPGG